jgi:hypothetical protein
MGDYLRLFADYVLVRLEDMYSMAEVHRENILWCVEHCLPSCQPGCQR